LTNTASQLSEFLKTEVWEFELKVFPDDAKLDNKHITMKHVVAVVLAVLPESNSCYASVPIDCLTNKMNIELTVVDSSRSHKYPTFLNIFSIDFFLPRS
jgi:hypothetical protein